MSKRQHRALVKTRPIVLFVLLWGLSAGQQLQRPQPVQELCCFKLEAQPAGTEFRGVTIALPTELSSEDDRHCLDVVTSQLVDKNGKLSDRSTLGAEIKDAGGTFADGCSRAEFTIENTLAGEQCLAFGGEQEFVLRPGLSVRSRYRFFSAPTIRDSEAGLDGGDIVVRLFLKDQVGSCRTPTMQSPSTAPVKTIEIRRLGIVPAVGVGPAAGTNPLDTMSSCVLSSSAASLSPETLFVGPADGTVYNESSTFTADINPAQSTIFRFAVPHSFSANQSRPALCALQFRLPICSQLPEGYPCYTFSGMEQEVVQHSGLRFDFVQDSPQPNGWATSPLVQLWPGEDTLVGTFECRDILKPNGEDQVLSWLAQSVNGFFIHFLQAGGPGAYGDGVGLWMVACA